MSELAGVLLWLYVRDMVLGLYRKLICAGCLYGVTALSHIILPRVRALPYSVFSPNGRVMVEMRASNAGCVNIKPFPAGGGPGVDFPTGSRAAAGVAGEVPPNGVPGLTSLVMGMGLAAGGGFTPPTFVEGTIAGMSSS
jgi:hypothetical protein